MRERTEPPRLWALGFGLWMLDCDGSSLKHTLAKPSDFLLRPASCVLSPGANK